MVNSGDFYVGNRQNTILYDPQQKKGKRGTKKGIFGFEAKSSKIFENEKKIETQIYRIPFTLFTIFDKILRKEVIYYSHLIF